MHTVILQLQDFLQRLLCGNSIIQQSQNLIQQQNITFLSSNYLSRKIQCIQDIIIFFLFFLIIKLLIAFFHLFEPENLDILILQFLQEIQFAPLLTFQKLNNDHTLTVGRGSQALANFQRSLALSTSTVNFCKFLFHDRQFLLI